MIVTIDGPAGSGKSTAARKLAARMEVAYLDTGAMYRAIAFAAMQASIDVQDSDSLIAFARRMPLDVDCGPTHTRVRIDGHDVSEAIRTIAVSAVTSSVAKHASIRELMVEHQRRIGASLGAFVSEGRDQGSVVFPQADAKFVLEASLQKRAQRRLLELEADGEVTSIEEVAENLRSRDEVDSKQWEPLLRGSNAIVLDTTKLTIHEVIERMLDMLPPRTGQGC